jgi:hypothetical protein
MYAACFRFNRHLLLMLAGLAAFACTPGPRAYTYPSKVQQELTRVCQRVTLRHAKQFLVEDGKIYPILRSGDRLSPLEEEFTNLADRAYLCGPVLDRNLPCPAGRKYKGNECR